MLPILPYGFILISVFIFWDGITNPPQTPMDYATLIDVTPRAGVFYVTGCAIDYSTRLPGSQDSVMFALRPPGQTTSTRPRLFYRAADAADAKDDERSGLLLHGGLDYLSDLETGLVDIEPTVRAPQVLVLDSVDDHDWHTGLVPLAIGTVGFVVRFLLRWRKSRGEL